MMRRLRTPLLAVSFGLAASAAMAQQTDMSADSAGGTADATVASQGNALRQRGWLFTPRVGIDLTQTDNVALQNSNGQRGSDLIVRVSPALNIQARTARIQASVDVGLQQVSYMNHSSSDRTQRSLNGIANVELVDDWMYLDLNGRIARQAISAFGTPASGSDSINSNVVETRSYRVSPYIKGRLLGAADYLLRFDNTLYSANNGPMRDTTIQTVQGSLAGATPLSLLNWGLDASAQQVEYSTGAQNKTDSIRGNLSYAVNPGLRVRVIHGQESNDYVNSRQQTTNINGWGFDWVPNERTRLGWTQENRYFGTSHNFNLTYRTPHTAWIVKDSRDVYVQPPQLMAYQLGTNFSVLNELLKSQYPNATDEDRTALVTLLLQAYNLSPDAPVLGGFMASRASINESREVSFVWSGVRNVITVSAQDSKRTALATGANIPVDDFSNFGSTIRQRGVNLNWSHKLTSNATLTLGANRSKVSTNTSSFDTDRDTYSLIMSRKLGAHTSGSVGYRRTTTKGYVDYVENAILGSLLMTF